MNVGEIWELVKSREVGGDSGRSDVMKVLNKVWLEEAAAQSHNAKDLGRIMSALDNGDFQSISPDDYLLLEYGLERAGFDELIKLLH